MKVEIIDRDVARVVKGMSPGQRIAAAFSLWRFARRIMASLIRAQRPDCSREEIEAEIRRRLSHGT